MNLKKSFLVILALICVFAPAQKAGASLQSDYAPVNGLKMYYEVQGKGEPVLLLHGAYMTLEGPIRALADSLSATRQVIMAEMQAHGRTPDIDRPITYEHMADDVAALIRHLDIESLDVLGYSMGGGVALQLAMRHPELVKKMVVISASYSSAGVYQILWNLIPTMTVEMFEGSPMKQEYDSLAPNPRDFSKLFAKLKQLDSETFDWGAESIRAITAPVLLIIGDSDATKPEHAVEMFRLLGGGVMGDLSGMPKSQLAILPGCSHVGIMYRLGWISSMVKAFLAG